MRAQSLIKILAFTAAGLLAAAPISAQTTWYVDDDAPGDPGPGDPLISDPEENGTADHPFDAIQEGIIAAMNGDTVLVLQGTYTGAGDRDLEYGGRLITVRSESGPESCIIDLTGATGSRAFFFRSGEADGAVADGFTVTGGWCTSGTGITVWSGAPTVTHCVFSNNYGFHGGGGAFVGAAGAPATRFEHCTFSENSGAGAARGGGLLIESGSVVLVDCRFSGNTANVGGGLDVISGTASLTHCEFVQNTATQYGGAINVQMYGFLPSVVNCAFIENAATLAGGGIAVWDRNANYTYVNVYNSTFAGNQAPAGCCLAANTAWVSFWVGNSILWQPDPVFVENGAGFYPLYCDAQGYGGGMGNIDADPLYVDPSSGDYRLGTGSPCIDAASSTAVPADAYDLDDDGDTSEPIPVDLAWMPRIVDDPNTSDTGVGFPCVDMGAYEFQPVGDGVEVAAVHVWPARIWSAAPNPARTTTTVVYTTAEQVAALEVFDLVGRRIATLSDNAAARGGIRKATWNGMNSQGMPVVSGVYLIRLGTAHGTDCRSIVLLR
jgi:predicted outer membrane repeat protein